MRVHHPVAGTLVVLVSVATTVVVAAQSDLDRAQAYFKEAAALCERDGGRLWGVSLCGPMVFAATPPDNFIAANQPMPAGNRPPVLGFANTAIDWGGARWSTFIWSMVPADEQRARGRMMMHELFHRVQPQLGLLTVGRVNDHLDLLEGRYWLRLEWRALSRALGGAGSERLEALRDALSFRYARRSVYLGSAESERADEIREGLAQYTGTLVAMGSLVDAEKDAIAQLAEAEKAPTFVKTFGYPSGAAYGLLLDAFSPGWTRRLKPSDDLGQLVMTAAGIKAMTAGFTAVASRYGGEALRAVEQKRDQERQVRAAELRRRFVENPVLVVPRGRGAILNTTGVTTLREGTVYFEYRVTGEWGSLESTGGILEHVDGATLRLPIPFHRDGDAVVGDGWRIVLAPGWTLGLGGRQGDFQILRELR